MRVLSKKKSFVCIPYLKILMQLSTPSWTPSAETGAPDRLSERRWQHCSLGCWTVSAVCVLLAAAIICCCCYCLLLLLLSVAAVIVCCCCYCLLLMLLSVVDVIVCCCCCCLLLLLLSSVVAAVIVCCWCYCLLLLLLSVVAAVVVSYYNGNYGVPWSSLVAINNDNG